MSDFGPDVLLARLRAFGVQEGARLCVAYSGGLDSTVLLHVLAQTRAFELRAAHVDHQLHSSSGEWRARCAASAAQLSVPFNAALVQVDAHEEGLEAGARRARYDALRAMVQPGEILVTAHHADDQLETMLLALLRGAGVRGLSGVPADQPFGSGRLLRPLLEFTRTQLERWAREHALDWIEDPSNANVSLDRNFLRARITPILGERWPAAAMTAARSAAHLQETDRILRAVAEADLNAIRVGDCVDAAGLAHLEPARRRNALRHWLSQRGARMPSSRKLASIEHDMLEAAADRVPCVEWDDVALRRYRGLLHLERRAQPLEVERLTWTCNETLQLPGDLGSLSLVRDPVGTISRQRLAPTLCVRFRVGGERIRLADEAHRRSLKKMLQAAGVPPWRRSRLPLIYSEDRLAAVGDLWVSEEFAARETEEAVRIEWVR